MPLRGVNAVRSAFPQSDQQTALHGQRRGSIGPFEIAHPRFIISTEANAECAAPRGQPQTSPGQSEVAPAAERRPGFRSPPGARRAKRGPSQRHAAEPESIRTSPRAVGCGLVRLPASWLVACSAAGAGTAGYPGRRVRLPRAAMWLLLRSGEVIRHGADQHTSQCGMRNRRRAHARFRRRRPKGAATNQPRAK